MYIGCVAVAAAIAAALSGWLWPVPDHTPPPWTIVTILALVTLAGRFPIRLSKQADASLLIVPLFMAVLLLHPIEAILVAVAGTIVSEILIKAPPRAIAFNSAVNSLAAGVAGIVFMALKPQGMPFAIAAPFILPVVASGATLLVANIALVDTMVTVRKGFGFWQQWSSTFAFESFQEAGLLPAGILAAHLAVVSWWAPAIVTVPAIMAYMGFHKIVSDAGEKARLAEDLQHSLTELKEVQAQLISSAKMASIGNLATGIAHEINNPVFAISGRADLLLRGADKHLASDKAREYVANIQEMAGRITSITAHLRDYAQHSDDMRDVMLNETIEAAVALLGKNLASVRLLRDYQGVPMVSGVTSQLQQVFVDLISNAVEASPEWASITVGCRVEDGRAIAWVADEGVGIDEEMQAHLFEPFASSKAVDSRVGLGLGLYTCHQIVTGHNGDIRIESQPGKGTTVTVSLPLAESARFWEANETFNPDEHRSVMQYVVRLN